MASPEHSRCRRSKGRSNRPRPPESSSSPVKSCKSKSKKVSKKSTKKSTKKKKKKPVENPNGGRHPTCVLKKRGTALKLGKNSCWTRAASRRPSSLRRSQQNCQRTLHSSNQPSCWEALQDQVHLQTRRELQRKLQLLKPCSTPRLLLQILLQMETPQL